MNEKQIDHVRRLTAQERSGRLLAAAFTSEADHELQDVFRSCAGDAPVALIATGGYGRNELAPYSDIDIMFFAKDKHCHDAAERVLYALWDRKLDISHSFRTPDECVDEAFSDIRTRTSLLESRFIAGSEDAYRVFEKSVFPVIAYRKQKDFVREKIRELERRRKASGSSVYLLEPHLKEGEGSLRDIHTIRWLSRVVFRTDPFDEGATLISAHERRRLAGSYDFLLRMRFCLHLQSGRKNDVLGFEHQKGVAACLGFADTKKFSGAERMMRYFYLKSRIIREITHNTIAVCSGQFAPVFRDLSVRKIGRGFLLSAGKIIPDRPEMIPNNADRIMECYAMYAKTGKPFSPRMKAAIRENLLKVNRKSRHGVHAIQSFLEILRSGRVYETLREMHEDGVLGRFLPEFGALRALVVHEPYHLYTVDEHTLFAVRNLEQLRTTTFRSLGDLREIMNRTGDLDVLYLSILLHDIGKSVGRHHEEEGYKRLKNILDRFHLDTRKRLRIEFLVRNHVLMSVIALRREVSDPEIIAQFADTVEDADNLQALYLMTYADMSAVNPTFWSEWKEVLLKELYLRTLERLSGSRRNTQDLIESLQSSLREDEKADFRRFSGAMPERYFLATVAGRVMDDYRLVSEAESTGCAVHVAAGDEDVAEISVAAQDMEGLFARIVGFLSLKGLNIVSGRVFTGVSGVALDRISVSNWKAIWWDGLEKDIVRGLIDVVTTRRDLVVPRSTSGARGPHEVFIELDNESSDAYTLVEIFCRDRIGLLYEISRLMYSLRVDIVTAKITTEAGLAQDVFSVRKDKKKLDGMDALELIGQIWEHLEA